MLRTSERSLATRLAAPVAVGAMTALLAGCGGSAPKTPVTLALTGQGAVTQGPARVSCSDRCSRTIEVDKGARLVLRAHPVDGAKVIWGGACRRREPGSAVCSYSTREKTFVTVDFVRRGSRANPVAVGDWAGVPGGWQLRVSSVSRRAERGILAESSSVRKPARGGQYVVVALRARYVGGGKSRFGGRLLPGLSTRIRAVGSAATYVLRSRQNGCGPLRAELPAPDLQLDRREIFPGGVTRGRICFEVASRDAAGLLLQVRAPAETRAGRGVWFALRRISTTG